jgi:TonB-dependent receptor
MINPFGESQATLNTAREMFQVKTLSKCIRALVFSGISSSFLVGQALAQESSGDGELSIDMLEEVQVFGIRSSLRSAADRKKEAGTIVDSIVAEDIGDFPDKNIGEALQRVTGVQLGREFGEGVGISIRGVEPQLVNVEVNGVQSLGNLDPFAQSGRSQDFAGMASELVQALDVIKGSEARLTEGGVGGTVKIITRKPNDFKENYLHINAENQYNDLVEVNNQKYNVTGVYKFSEKVGGLLNLTFQDRNTTFHALRNTEWVRQGDYHNDGDADVNVKTFPNPDFADVTTRAGCGEDAACLSQFNDFRARIPRYSVWNRDEDRISANGMVQFEVTDNLSAYVGYTYTNRDFVQQDSNMQLEVASDRQLVRDEAGQVVAEVGPNNNVSQYTTFDALIVNRSVNNDWDITTSILDLGFDYEDGPLQIEGVFGYSLQEQEIDQVETRVASNRVQGIEVNFAGNGAPIYDMNQGFNRANTSQFFDIDAADSYWFYSRIQPENFNQENEQLSAKLDLNYTLEDGFFTKLRAGTRYASEFQSHERERFRLTRIVGNDYNGDTWTQEEQNALVAGNSTRIGNFMQGYDLGVPTVGGWLALNPGSFENAFNVAHADNITPESTEFAQQDFYEVDMDVLAFYLQGDFETEIGGMPLWGNVGARYVTTDVDTTGNARIAVQVDVVPGSAVDGNTIDPNHPDSFEGVRTLSTSYSEFLPSFNLNLGLIEEELTLYFGAAKVMAHPKAKDLNISARCTIRLDTLSQENGLTNTCRAGNPRLQPYVGNQWDLALNWYPTRDTTFSVAYFEKNLDTYVVDASEQFGVDFFGDGTRFDVTQVTNGAGATTKGVELSGTLFFSALPSFLGDTGVTANYTRMSADDVGLFNSITGEELPFPSQSEDSYNITLFYETDTLSVKFAYNYRDEYLLRPSDRGGNPVFFDDAGFLDAKIVYRPDSLENFRFYADVRNLLEEGNTYVNGPGRVSQLRYSGREWAAGFTYTF